jgi:uncharacterized protein
MAVSLRSPPVLQASLATRFRLEGELGRRLAACTEQWILPTPLANPAILEMFRDRDRQPYRQQVPWAGEFAGKYLTHMVQIYRLTREPRLREQAAWFVGELCALQAEDGYLGPWPKDWRLKKGAPTCGEPWDAWGHYHAMLGLLLWHDETGDERAMACCRRIGDLFCTRFLTGSESLHDAGAHEMNQAPVHALAMLYQRTGEGRYLAMAEKIVAEFAKPPAGDYLQGPLRGLAFHELPKPRWESLHPIMGLSELYTLTGKADYRTAFTKLWWDMAAGDRHNNGGFTSGEKATGNPYDRGAIETCCTVAWLAMSVEMLKLTGDAIVADELELAMWNSGLGMMSPSGRWVTYDTPMEGDRKASAHSIVFQARAGQPELNCCSVNGPRALGLLSEWALMQQAGGMVLNYYGPGQFSAPLPDGSLLTLTQQTDYPRDGQVDLLVQPAQPCRFALALRIPHWSTQTHLALNGLPLPPPPAGQYLTLDRLWQPGDRLSLAFDMRPHYWVWRASPAASRDFATTWQVYGPHPRGAQEAGADQPPVAPVLHPDLAQLTTLPSLPAQLRVGEQDYPRQTIEAKDGILDQRQFWPAGPVLGMLYGATEITVSQADELVLSFAADWWLSWVLNGEVIYDNHAHGGHQHQVYHRLHEVTLKLRPGRNVLAFRLSGGRQRGCWLSVGCSPFASERVVARAGDEVAQASIYRGPLLLAWDGRYNTDSAPDSLAPLPARELELRRVEDSTWLKPWLLLACRDSRGHEQRLCDFASAGLAGNAYYTWLPVRGIGTQPAPFSASAPLRSVRPQ